MANGRALMRERIFRDRTNPLETHDDKSMHKIINVVARWPGSTHDARILENSEVGRMFERQSSGYSRRRFQVSSKTLVDDAVPISQE